MQHVWRQNWLNTTRQQLKQTSMTQWPLTIRGFPVSPHRLCWLWCVLMHESRFSRIICGLQWDMGWHQSVQVFAFSSIVASVGNSSVRAIFGMTSVPWDMGWSQSVQVFAFSSTVASVGNSSIKAAIFVWRLGCLNMKKYESIALNAFRPARYPTCFSHMPVFFSVVRR